MNESMHPGLDAWPVWWTVAVLVVMLAVSYCIGRWWLRQRRRRIAQRALSAERHAVGLLRSHGYTVLETQVRRVWQVQQGARCLEIPLRADALVRRGNRRYIAEVKSTALVADLKHGPTRRQLLEYALAYGTDGVLLVDMHERHVEEISFPGLESHPRPLNWSLLWLCAVLFAFGLWLGKTGLG